MPCVTQGSAEWRQTAAGQTEKTKETDTDRAGNKLTVGHSAGKTQQNMHEHAVRTIKTTRK